MTGRARRWVAPLCVLVVVLALVGLGVWGDIRQDDAGDQMVAGSAVLLLGIVVGSVPLGLWAFRTRRVAAAYPGASVVTVSFGPSRYLLVTDEEGVRVVGLFGRAKYVHPWGEVAHVWLSRIGRQVGVDVRFADGDEVWLRPGRRFGLVRSLDEAPTILATFQQRAPHALAGQPEPAGA
jgi:hypothetical protein